MHDKKKTGGERKGKKGTQWTRPRENPQHFTDCLPISHKEKREVGRRRKGKKKKKKKREKTR